MTAPVLQAFLLAEHIYQDVASKKFVICGVFNQVVCKIWTSDSKNETGSQNDEERWVPIHRVQQAGTPFAYIRVTNFHAVRVFELRYTQLATSRVLLSTTFELGGTDPIRTYEVCLPVPKLPVKDEGSYALELLCDDELLGSHRVTVVHSNDEARERERSENDNDPDPN